MTAAEVTATRDGEVVIEYRQRVCVRCVLPESFPGTGFDGAGVCTHCLAAEARVLSGERGVREGIAAALATAAPGRAYDAVALCGGGRDSSLALLRLAGEHGLRVLALTVDIGFHTERAGANMRAVVDSAAVDHVVFRPHQTFMRELYRAGMETDFGVGTATFSTAACGVCVSLVLAVGVRFARSNAAPILAGGWTGGRFATSPVLGLDGVRDVVGRHFGPLSAAGDLDGRFAELGLDGDGADPTLVNPLHGAAGGRAGEEAELVAHGWRPPEGADSCAANCRLSGLLVVDHVRRHGYHPYVYELAHHVRQGLLDREEALGRMRRVRVAGARGRPTP